MIVSFTQRAERDIDSILFELEERAGLATALRMVDHIESRCRSLEQFPERGPRLWRSGANDLRYILEGPYLIICRLEARSVAIVAVLHGARDISVALGDDGEP